ncbi:STAS/SEC14 domain-containing protein [Marivirga arenosa]|uniref:STAS/SEC14 domain-containing protein n=1 Tax=Marivirga arenosa TaxID=3059076 RepID=A0AA51N752_9BACT|nr:STAS/SEC14 domain-containing protein [Marivirga sp. ABR2-2]WMN07541.1 STAS/SEC14 domain-containing protein [Marivirga sp. ABR2-2]
MTTTISENIKIEEVQELSAAMITFKGAVSTDDYRQVMEANYELSKKPEINNWLQNNTDAGVLSLQDQQWVSNDLIPRAAQEVDKIAVVVSKDVFRKFAAKNILDKQKGKLNFQYFNSLEEARTWLKS